MSSVASANEDSIASRLAADYCKNLASSIEDRLNLVNKLSTLKDEKEFSSTCYSA
jgi:urocanate hydratase